MVTSDVSTPAADSWRSRVESHHAQSLRIMDESWRQGDFWRTLAPMFRADPHRTDDEALNELSEFVRGDSTVLDVGGGAGRFAVALAFKCRSVTVVDPSESMLAQLRKAVTDAGRSNVEAVLADWETADVEPSELILCSHVVYGVADVRPFIEKLNSHSRRLVIMLSFVDSPQSKVAPLWEPVYGEQRINLPALPELMNVLWEMNIFPNVAMLTPSAAQVFETIEEVLDEVGRMMFVANESEARARLESVISDYLEHTDDGFRLKGGRPVRQGVVSWEV